MPSRLPILLCVSLGVLVIGWLSWRSASSDRQLKKASGVTVSKQPVNLANRNFDPASPPSDMPPFAPGEAAACDSAFLADVTVGGQPQRIDATHATLAVTHIHVKLELGITIWAPADTTSRVMEHEQGHRQIAEYYYQNADKLAERIAGEYIGREVQITGADLEAESNKSLQQIAIEITNEYKRELNPGPTQLLYDDITDHSRNDVVVKDAVDHAIKNAAIESTPRTGSN